MNSATRSTRIVTAPVAITSNPSSTRICGIFTLRVSFFLIFTVKNVSSLLSIQTTSWINHRHHPLLHSYDVRNRPNLKFRRTVCSVQYDEFSSALFSTSSSGSEPRGKFSDSSSSSSSISAQDSPPQPSPSEKRKFKKQNPKNSTQQTPFHILFRAIRTKIQRTTTSFLALSKKAKIIWIVQCSTLLFIFGFGVKMVLNHRQEQRSALRIPKERPMEISYSTFMDFMESNGKSTTRIDNLIIGKERIAFRASWVENNTPNPFSLAETVTTTPSATKLKTSLTDTSVSVTPPTSFPTSSSKTFYTQKIDASPHLIDFLRKNQISFAAAPVTATNTVGKISSTAIVFVYMIFLLRMFRFMNSGGSTGGSSDIPGKLAQFGKKKGANGNDEPLVTFDDIRGIDSAKFEVMELVDTLRHPDKYAILGARPPRGLLLEGPPGTGKTLLARACAASAGVPLLYCSGSDFVEMFVGRGAARVRKTFERAKKIAPCIIFIDELDTLGKSRAAGEFMGLNMKSNDEAEQTLNQLLACMDGLDTRRGICVLAATNRKEVLDQALTRPGRFDRIIQVPLPDSKGREEILRVYTRKLPGFSEGSGIDEKRIGSLGKGNKVDLSAVAAVTSGLAGAELEFIVNEAAIRAVRRVTKKLREGVDPSIITPCVNAIDFEESVRNFYDTRRVNGSGTKMGGLLNNVLRPKT